MLKEIRQILSNYNLSKIINHRNDKNMNFLEKIDNLDAYFKDLGFLHLYDEFSNDILHAEAYYTYMGYSYLTQVALFLTNHFIILGKRESIICFTT